MFDNIGSQIKSVSVIACVAGIVICVLGGVVFMFNGEFLIGLLVLVLGCAASYLGVMMAYGFGELIERTVSIDERLARMEKQSLKAAGEENEQTASNTRAATIGTYRIPGAVSSAASAGEKWKCPKCGTQNERTCQFCRDCGEYRSASNTRAATIGTDRTPGAVSPAASADEKWKCPECGTQNERIRLFCKDCGKYR